MWHNLATVLVVAFLVFVPLSHGLYFHIGETERKCFIEEIPDETMVTGKVDKCNFSLDFELKFTNVPSNLSLFSFWVKAKLSRPTLDQNSSQIPPKFKQNSSKIKNYVIFEHILSIFKVIGAAAFNAVALFNATFLL